MLAALAFLLAACFSARNLSASLQAFTCARYASQAAIPWLARMELAKYDPSEKRKHSSGRSSVEVRDQFAAAEPIELMESQEGMVGAM